MLTKHMRKKLQEHDWLEIARRDSNPNQALLRLRRQAKRAIDDLALLAQKLPNDTQQWIFNYPNFQKLVKSVLKQDSNDKYPIGDDARRTELASLLVRSGTDFCTQQYKLKIETSSALNEPIISQLQKSKDICDGIAFKMKLPQIQSIEQNEDLIYLFNWGRIEDVHEVRPFEVKGEDTRKFIEFCEKEYTPIDTIHRINHISSDVIEFDFTSTQARRIYGYIHVAQNIGDFWVMEGDDWKIIRHLVVKKEGEAYDDMYVYMKSNAN